jgi:hypothetical protein
VVDNIQNKYGAATECSDCSKKGRSGSGSNKFQGRQACKQRYVISFKFIFTFFKGDVSEASKSDLVLQVEESG